jgi:hypothetical protein
MRHLGSRGAGPVVTHSSRGQMTRPHGTSAGSRSARRARRHRALDPYPRDRSDKDPAPREPPLASIIRCLEICVLREICGHCLVALVGVGRQVGPRRGPRITRIQRIRTSERMNAPLRFPRCGTRRGAFQPWADDAVHCLFRPATSQCANTHGIVHWIRTPGIEATRIPRRGSRRSLRSSAALKSASSAQSVVTVLLGLSPDDPSSDQRLDHK